MPLTPYAIREWGLATLVALALAIVFALLGWWWGLIPVFILWFAVASFFRDPIRRVPTGLPDGVLLSPADGVISAIEHPEHHAVHDGPATVIRIFLSVLNVHVNRAPCDGVVVGSTHTPGRYHDARTPESATENESQLVTIRLDDGRLLGMRLIAGKVARRIVCPLREGDRLTRGSKFGMIKFGSSAELILPRSAQFQVHVNVGDAVRGGLTQIATLAPAVPSAQPDAGMAAVMGSK